MQESDLDDRIRRAVKETEHGRGAYMRVYADDPWRHTIYDDLRERGFVNIDVPDIIIKGDVYFEWTE